MAFVTYGTEFRPALHRALTRTFDAAGRNVRLTALISVFAMFACFAAATALEMRRDYAHALAMADAFTEERAQTLAGGTALRLDRLAALANAWAEAPDSAESIRMIKAAGSRNVLNVALADADGRFVSAAWGAVTQAKPLDAALLLAAQHGQSIQPFSDTAIGSSPLTLVIPANDKSGRVIVMPLDPLSLLSKGIRADAGLFRPDGIALALSNGWQDPPPAAAMRGTADTLRHLDYDGERRVVALSSIQGWSLTAAVSMRASAALDSWYGSLPLYVFVIIGPALAGAALAMLLVRECERADRARSALVAVKAIGKSSAMDDKLLVRLTESERRASDAQRAKAEFFSNMSHELRTPLNAIIGFAEIIAGGVFGPAGHAKYTEYAGDIASAGRHLHYRIGEILEFAAVEAGRQPLVMEAVDIGLLAKKCVDQAQGETLGRRIALGFKGAALPAAYADASAVRRILTLMIANAMRHTRDCGAIRVETRKEEGTLVVVVRDGGASPLEGEPPRDGKAIPAISGSGLALGLSMAVGLARRMGGALRLGGAAGDGIWAELRLPLN